MIKTSVLPKMSARSGLVGKKSSRFHLGAFQVIFSMDQKHATNLQFLSVFLGGPVAAIQPSLLEGHLSFDLRLTRFAGFSSA